MSEEVKKDTNAETGFSREYVKELRDEAANWRIKYQEVRTQLTTGTVKQELQSRGINAEPGWVDYNPDRETAQEAVNRFIQQYPHLVPSVDENALEGKPEAPKAPRVMTPGARSNTNNVDKQSTGSLKGRSLEEIRKDPKARNNLREQYRTMLREASYQKNNEF